MSNKKITVDHRDSQQNDWTYQHLREPVEAAQAMRCVFCNVELTAETVGHECSRKREPVEERLQAAEGALRRLWSLVAIAIEDIDQMESPPSDLVRWLESARSERAPAEPVEAQRHEIRDYFTQSVCLCGWRIKAGSGPLTSALRTYKVRAHLNEHAEPVEEAQRRYWCGHSEHVPGDCPTPPVEEAQHWCKCGEPMEAVIHDHMPDTHPERLTHKFEPVEEAQRYWCGHSEHVPGDCPAPPVEVEDEGARPHVIREYDGAGGKLWQYTPAGMNGQTSVYVPAEVESAIRKEATAALTDQIYANYADDLDGGRMWLQLSAEETEDEAADLASDHANYIDLWRDRRALRLELAVATAQIAHWKANHDEQVRRKRAISQLYGQLIRNHREFADERAAERTRAEAAEGALREHPLIKAATRLREAEATLAPAIEAREGIVRAHTLIARRMVELREAARALTAESITPTGEA